MVSFNNSAPVGADSTGTLEDCFTGCKAHATCKYWTYNLDDTRCTFHHILRIEEYIPSPNMISGEKHCGGTCEYW